MPQQCCSRRARSKRWPEHSPHEAAEQRREVSAVGRAEPVERELDALARELAALLLQAGPAPSDLEQDLARVALLGAAGEQALRHGGGDLAAGARGVDAEQARDLSDRRALGLGHAHGVEQPQLAVVHLGVAAERRFPELDELFALKEAAQGDEVRTNRL